MKRPLYLSKMNLSSSLQERDLGISGISIYRCHSPHLFLSPSSTLAGGRFRLSSGLNLRLFFSFPPSLIRSTCSFVHVSSVSDLILEMCLQKQRDPVSYSYSPINRTSSI